MLKFVVTRKSNRSSMKKQCRKVAKSLTPTKKHDKASKGLYTQLDSSVILTLGKIHRAPSPPTSLVNDVIRKHKNANYKCDKLFQSAKKKACEDQGQKASSKRGVAKNVSFKDYDIYVRRISKNDAWNISQPMVNQDFNRSIRKHNIHRNVVNRNNSLNVSHLSNKLNSSRVNRSNSLNISQFSLNSSLGELSFHMQLYDNQLKRIKHKTEKLRERDTVIREKFEAVRRKAKRLNAIDHGENNGLMNKTFLCDASSSVPSQHPKHNEDDSVMIKPRDETSIFDNNVCVTRNKLNKASIGLSPLSAARKNQLRRSSNSPKRLKHQRLAQKLPRLTSPLARSAKEFSSTRDVILRALSKDKRKFTFC